jgi:hypothetical protein
LYTAEIWFLVTYIVLIFCLSGVGKSSLVHLLLNGSSIARPAQTVGCEVGIKVGTLVLSCPCLFHLHLYPLTPVTVIISACYLWKCRGVF